MSSYSEPPMEIWASAAGMAAVYQQIGAVYLTPVKPQHWVVVIGVAFGLSAALIFGARSLGPSKLQQAEAFAEQPERSLAPLWPAPAFAYRDQRGATVTLDALRGKVWVANFIFTQCRTICPLLSAKMVQLQRQLAGVDVRFVSFSVDPAHDTPEVLAAYAHQWHAEETRWLLLATDEQTLPATAAGFHVTAKKNDAPGALDPILHSGVFVVVDAEGLVRGVYDSEHKEDFQALARDLRRLSGLTGPPPPAAPRSGQALYHELSCAACHERPELAPPLYGLKGKRRELEGAQLVTADAAYVRESLVVPDAKRLLGYPLRMPTYDGVVSEAELSTLVDYVLSLPEQAAPDERAHVEVDPVCHMKVRVADGTPSASFDGGTWWFCAEVCRDRFLKTPGAFAGAPLDR